MESKKKILKNKWLWASIFVVCIIIALGFFLGGEKGQEVVLVNKGEVVQEISLTGTLVAVGSADLSFERTGRITSVPVDVGDRVNTGDLLARIEQVELISDVARARAVLVEEQARLQELRNTSQNEFSDARSSAIAAIKDAFNKSDDAIRNNIDQFFKNPRQSNTYVDFSFEDGPTVVTFPLDVNLVLRIGAERYEVEKSLIAWEDSLKTIDSNESLDGYINQAETTLNQIRLFLNQMALATNSLVPPDFSYQTTINTYKNQVASARNIVSASLSSVIAAKSALGQAPVELNGVFAQIQAAEARIAQFEAQVSSAEAQLLKTELRAPLDGVITRQDARLGEIASVGVPVVSIISDSDYEIEANVSEINIGKVAVGNAARVTFDAFPGNSFMGTVTYIEPAETIIDGVVNFKIKVVLDTSETNLRSGLTANLEIETSRRDDVVRIPRYSVVTEEGMSFVRVRLSRDDVRRIPVELGLLGSDGYAEVLSGLEGGETLVLSE